MFDDIVSKVFSVILTSTGLAKIEDKCGSITRHFKLTQSGCDDGISVDVFSVSRSRQDIGTGA